MNGKIDFEEPQEPAPEAPGRVRQRAAKRYLCEARFGLFLETGKVKKGELCRLTDEEIWKFGDKVRRVRDDDTP